VGRPRSGFVDSGYKAFRDFHINRPKVVYVGANDGMLHGLDGTTGAALMSYVPRGVFARLSEYTDPTYVHKYFVDGPIIPGDAYVDGAWKTFLIGGLGAGGKGFFGLDITNPTSFAESNAASVVKFDYTAPSEALPVTTPNAAVQFSDETGTSTLAAELATDLGHIMGDSVRDAQVGRSMQIAKMQNGRWAFITGNGVNSVNERPALYIVYLDAVGGFQKIVANNAQVGDNGLSAPLPLDTNSDGMIDTVYAGDIKGKLWKFTSDASGVFAVGNTTLPLIDVAKPITSAPVVAAHPKGGLLVSFGTGRLLTVPDKTSLAVQSIYGVWDKPGAAGTVATSALAQQTLSGPVASVDGPLVRTLSGTKPNYATQRGWYMNLSVSGERIVYNPISDLGIGYFATLVPIEGTSCSAGGQAGSYLAFSLINGRATPVPTIDINNDGLFNSSDHVAGGANSTNTVVGLALGIGKLAGNVGKRNTVSNGSRGTVRVRGNAGPGRVMWRDLTP
jgi:type IV pilus assembly protein PilY1